MGVKKKSGVDKKRENVGGGGGGVGCVNSKNEKPKKTHNKRGCFDGVQSQKLGPKEVSWGGFCVWGGPKQKTTKQINAPLCWTGSLGPKSPRKKKQTKKKPKKKKKKPKKKKKSTSVGEDSNRGPSDGRKT